jgi:hypothetical protein
MRATWSDLLFTNVADFTAQASFTSEASLLTGPNQQPTFLAGTWADYAAVGKVVRITAEGIVGSTGTPTYLFQLRLGTTQGATDLTGSSIGVSDAITTASGISNQWWKLDVGLTCTVAGQGANNVTLKCSGSIRSPSGFAAPYEYILTPTDPPTATWTAATINGAATQYFNLSVTCSASSASNTITCKKLEVRIEN